MLPDKDGWTAFASPLFRRLLLSAFLLILTSLVALDFYLSRYTAQREVQEIERRLAAEARVLSTELVPVAAAGLEQWARDAAQRAQARVTIVDRSGRVLADSEHDPETMENHAGRPEIRSAFAGKTGAAIRHSATLDRDFSYVALTAPWAQQTVVLRLAVPIEELETAVAAVRWRIVQASMIVAAVALLIAYLFSVRFARRVRRLQSFAETLALSPSAEPLVVESSDELGALARSLNRMAEQLRTLLEELNVESARREAILASMVEGVLAVDHELRVTFCNESFARAVGAEYPVPERLPVLSLARDPALVDLLTKVLVSGDPMKQRIEIAAPEDRSFEVQAAPLVSRSRRGAIAILHEVTELERLERVRKDFVANVSHELRTPLTAIQGYTETLLDGAVDDPEHNRRFLDIIQAHTVRLNNIASDLLALSDLESGRPGGPSEEIAISAAIGSAIHTIEAEAAARNVRLIREDIAEASVTGYRLRLEQAIINILANAVKFNRPNGEVHIGAVKGGDQVRITISDTGAGIPSDQLPRVFERFYRVDKARSRAVGGTGLGLSIAKHAVESMGGRILAESELGRGSAFTIVLPAV
jgi:two-component system phosphate regulon sensor histidine kinase PhoR